jgi:hypothetical protein
MAREMTREITQTTRAREMTVLTTVLDSSFRLALALRDA